MATELSAYEMLHMPRPSGSLSYGNRIVNSGEYYDTPYGECMLILTSGTEYVYYAVTKAHPHAKDKLGRFYNATAVEVRNDMQYAGAGTIRANLGATQATIQLWLDCFLGAVALAGGPVAWAAAGVPVMDAVSKNYNKIPAYRELIEAIMEVRSILQPNCVVLWTRIIDKFLQEMAKELPSLGASVLFDVLKGKMISRNVLTRVIGYSLSIKRSGWPWRKKVMLIKCMLQEVGKKVIVHMKKEGFKELKEEQIKGLAKWVITYLGSEGTHLSINDAEGIVREMSKNAGVIEPAIDRLIRAMNAVEMLNEA